jgi:hypothetical protein
MSYPTKAWVENTPVEGKDGGTFEIIAEAGYGMCISVLFPQSPTIFLTPK